MWGEVIGVASLRLASVYESVDVDSVYETTPAVPGHGWMITPFASRDDSNHPAWFQVPVSLWAITKAVMSGDTEELTV